jgi:serine-type D-Ala-D-Ala carboxypeptidase/endopeptidase (penicillin-binding protein 4)
MRAAAGDGHLRHRWRSLSVAVVLAVTACTTAPETASPGDGRAEPPAAEVDPPSWGSGDEDDEPDAGARSAGTVQAVSPLTPVPDTRETLTRELAEVVTAAGEVAPELDLGVLVVDEAGREVVELSADTPLLPASTLKVVTAAAVLATLGPDTQLQTAVEATGGLTGDGRLEGDLVLVGAGDPTLVTDEYTEFIYPERPRTPLASLADQVVEAGVREVTGGVRGVAPGFDLAPLPTGWRDAYLATFDGRYTAGLTVDAGFRTLFDRLEEDDDEADEPVEGGADDEVREDGPLVDPATALPDPETVRVELATDPPLHAAAELTRLLEERGIEVGADPSTRPPEAPLLGRLAVVRSPSLAELLTFTVQRSDNHLADHLFHVVARARTGEASWERGARALEQVLARFDIDTTGAVFADGSGLSREDRLTPRQLVDLDRILTSSARFGGTWRSLQASAGRSGTLRGRLAGTPAAGRLLGKTGSLRDVLAVSGQVLAADADAVGSADVDERRYHLAVLGNDAIGGDRVVVRAVVDEIVLALVADLDGCQLVADGDDGPLGRPPSSVRCADG